MLVAEFPDGAIVPLDRCQWVLLEPCGCPRGAAKAGRGHAVTEADAWKAICSSGQRRAVGGREAFRMELMTVEAYLDNIVPLILASACPHMAVPA